MRVLLVTHGNLGESLLHSAARIYGQAVGVDFLSNDPHDATGLAGAIEEWLGPDDTDAMILVDVGGGSCGTAARLAADGRQHTWILGGVNLPMVLTCTAPVLSQRALESPARCSRSAPASLTLINS